jgi:hypothetical protein
MVAESNLHLLSYQKSEMGLTKLKLAFELQSHLEPPWENLVSFSFLLQKIAHIPGTFPFHLQNQQQKVEFLPHHIPLTFSSASLPHILVITLDPPE